MDHETFVKKNHQNGGLNSSTPHWKKSAGRGRKGEDANKGSEKGKTIVCDKCQGKGHYASDCTVYPDDGWGKRCKSSSKKGRSGGVDGKGWNKTKTKGKKEGKSKGKIKGPKGKKGKKGYWTKVPRKGKCKKT